MVTFLVRDRPPGVGDRLNSRRQQLAFLPAAVSQ
jgi:hypothetical protein